MKLAMIVTMLTMGLVACNKGGGSGTIASATASAGAAGSGAASTGATASATSDNSGGGGPLLKEGLWSTHSVWVDNPGGKKREGNQTVCRNHAFDDYARGLAKRQECTIKESFTGGGMDQESDCTVAGSVIKTKAKTTSTGDTTHSESHSTYTPAAYGVSESTMTMDEKYIGPCPSGTSPGDIMRADGTVMSRWKH